MHALKEFIVFCRIYKDVLFVIRLLKTANLFPISKPWRLILMSNFKTNEQSCTHSYVAGLKAIKSEPVGVWTAEFTLENLKKIKKMSEKFNGSKWAYVGVLTGMAPIVDPEVNKLFANMHINLEEWGCVACAFVVGGAIALKAQANRHHDVSDSKKLVISHFRTEEEAIKWIKPFVE